MATLGYWDGRGLAQPIRLLLEYTGTEYKEKKYIPGPPPDFDRSDWLKDKFNIGLDFPNLPYFFDGDIKLSQSKAIIRHIARKHDMVGKTEKEKSFVDMLENVTTDIRAGWRDLCYSSNFEDVKNPYISETLPSKLLEVSTFLGQKKWFIGDDITYVDFIFYEIIDTHRKLDATCLDKFDNLKRFMDRFESLEPIKNYMNSNRYISYPFVGPMASFGGRDSPFKPLK